MTTHKHLKQLVRARISKTGESYSTARRHVIRQAKVDQPIAPSRWHLPGNIPATTALRVLLTAAGVRDPRTGQPLTEAMLFGICGGIGLGSTSFYYAQADYSSFFLAGRHFWNDDLAYIQAALRRFGIEPLVRESTGSKAAQQHLKDAVAEGAPCIAWVDMANLPHRGMPAEFSGGGYHVVTIYHVDDDNGSALIGDLTDEPIKIDLRQLAVARARIKQFKNRLLSIPAANGARDLSAWIRAGLQACHSGLKRSSGKGAGAMSGLEALAKWRDQLGKASGKESWAEMFPRGHRLWQGLTFIHDFIENYHTGGGLCRPLFAEFLAEGATLKGWERLAPLSDRYAALGAAWSDLALTAIPQHVPRFSEVRELCALRAELRNGGNPDDVARLRSVWNQLADLTKKARSDFPLSQAQCAGLLAELHEKVATLHETEVAAHAGLGEVIR